MKMAEAVQIENLSVTFDKNIKALDNLSLDIEKGRITGIVGADSAGKTTLLRSITGLILPDCGKILTLNLNPVLKRDEINKKLGYMPQKFGLYEDLSVRENLELYAHLKEIPEENKEEIFYEDSEGNEKSYTPPRYEYDYEFNMTIMVDSPSAEELWNTRVNLRSFVRSAAASLNEKLLYFSTLEF